MTAARVALLQTCSGREIGANVQAILGMLEEAKAGGAELAAMPENATMVDRRRRDLLGKARTEAEHPAIPAFREAAARHGMWVLVGSLTIRLDDEHVANRSLLIDSSGEIAARYDKIHMFDVDLEGGETYRESSYVTSGREAVLADTPWGLMGLTICYDLRFAALYRSLAQAGAAILTVPACFTHFTGKAHWHVLLRARAIETGCFVIAPAQSGEHEDGRRTYGHSLVVAPWGEVIADGGEGTGVTFADMDMAKVGEARGMVPALKHDRPFAPPAVPAVPVRMAGE